MAYRRTFGRKRIYGKSYTKKRVSVRRGAFRKSYSRTASRYKSRLPRNDQTTKHTARLCYHQVITLDASTGTSIEYNFAANDCGDPDHTGTGHQPMGFDQLMPGKFDHYTVIGAMCRVRLLPTTGSNVAIPPMVGLRVTDRTGQTQGKDLSYLREMGISMKSMGSIISTDAERGLLRANFSAKKFFGKSAIVGDYLYRGDTSTPPPELAYFSICAVSPDAIVDPTSIKLEVYIEYIVVFTEPKLLPQS